MSEKKVEFDAVVENGGIHILYATFEEVMVKTIWIPHSADFTIGQEVHVTLTPIEPTEPELKPCPFCGESGYPAVMIVENLNNHKFYCRCMNCWAATREYGTRAVALASWNQRTE